MMQRNSVLGVVLAVGTALTASDAFQAAAPTTSFMRTPARRCRTKTSPCFAVDPEKSAVVDVQKEATTAPTTEEDASLRNKETNMAEKENADEKKTTVMANYDFSLEAQMDRLEDFREFEIQNTPSEQESNNTAVLGGDVSGLFWRGVVAALCALWASNFAVTKLVIAEPGVDSSLYAVARFTVAALALAPFALSSIRRSGGIDAETIRGAALCGSWVAFGYLGQLLGLLTTTASRSCVICSLHCVFVAVVAEFLRVSRSSTGSKTSSFDTKRLAPAAVAVLGVAIVELQGAAGPPTIGDALSFAQPIGFGMGYLQLEDLMRRRPDTALPVSAIKLMVVALASLGIFELGPLLHLGAAASSTTEALAFRIPDFGAILASPVAQAGVLYTALVTTALALWVESIAFARVPATDASIILTTEPLFAAAFSAISLGETFGVSDYVGASLIVGACVLAALLDNPGDKECVVEEDPSCEPPRKWPFWGF